MKSRAITLGASVIALMLTGAGQAQAGGPVALPEVGVKVPDAGVVAKVETNVSVPPLNSKASLKVDAHGLGRPQTTAKVEHRSTAGPAGTVETRQNVSVRSDRHVVGSAQLVGDARSRPRHAESAVRGLVPRRGKTRVHGLAHKAKREQERTERSIRAHSRPAAGAGELSPPSSPKRLTLKGIGREVGNPAHLILGGWLLVAILSGGFAAGRLARRLQRTV